MRTFIHRAGNRKTGKDASQVSHIAYVRAQLAAARRVEQIMIDNYAGGWRNPKLLNRTSAFGRSVR